jgi:hypothetical protein
MNDMYGEEAHGTVAQRAGWIQQMSFGPFVSGDAWSSK